MKIDGQYPKHPVRDKNVPRGKNEKSGSVGKQTPVEIDRDHKESFTVSKMRAKIDIEPDIDTDRVRELKEKLKKGEYQIDSRKLANTLLKESLLEDIS